jgi:hypothetical protein
VATAAKRQVFIVHGGPGTGKSVIAVRLLAEVLKSKRLGFLVAPNKAFRDTLAEQLTKRHRDLRADGEGNDGNTDRQPEAVVPLATSFLRSVCFLALTIGAQTFALRLLLGLGVLRHDGASFGLSMEVDDCSPQAD